MPQQRRPSPANFRRSTRPSSDRNVGPTSNVSPQDRASLPILNNEKNEKALLNHIMDRVLLADEERRIRIARIEAIDKQVSGEVSFVDPVERKRDADNKVGKKPKPVNHSLPLVDAQVEECVTYLMSIYSPETGMFESIAPVSMQALANAVCSEFNKRGRRAGYYRQTVKFCNNAIKYNFGAMTCYWEKHNGVVFKPEGAVVKKDPNGVVWEGNYLQTCNTYNFLYDTTVHLCDLALQGEFFVEIEPATAFKIRKMGTEKKLFGVNRFVGPKPTSALQRQVGNVGRRYYKAPPTMRNSGSQVQETDWVATLKGTGNSARDSVPAYELIKFVGWINPKDFGLSASDELQLWRVVVVNGEFIGFAVQLPDTNAALPVVTAAPIEDDLGNQQRSYAEKLLPSQHFASFLMNTHQDGVRKSVYGLSVFDANAFPGLDLTTEELFVGVIPMRSSAGQTDIDKVFRHYSTAPGTERHVEMIDQVVQLMQKFLPTNMLQQVTDLDRATEYQAAATVAAGNKKNFKIACVIRSQALDPLIELMYQNLLASNLTLNYIDPSSGKVSEVTTFQLASQPDLRNYIGTGIKGMDRLIVVNLLFKIYNAIVQNPAAAQEISIIRLLNYITSIAGDYTDLTQFKRTPEETQQFAQATAAGAAAQQAGPTAA